jgi:ElaB/YqjD/DUF883 family membrane-anchored ribosome-binding protein
MLRNLGRLGVTVGVLTAHKTKAAAMSTIFTFIDFLAKEHTMDDTATTTSDNNARERLAQSLKHMVDEADHLLAKAERTGSEQFLAAREKFETQLNHAKDELRRLEVSALENAKRAAHATDHAVHEHPYAAMGIAAGAGLLIGMLITRR